MWLADDDWLEPDILSACVEFLLRNPDYAMVSGDIVYWEDGHEVYREFDFNFDHHDPGRRVARYFRMVFVGGLFHSLCRAELVHRIPVKNVIASDWFFVSNMLFLGKNKNLRRDGYHKACRGISVSHQTYARTIGASNFAGYNPYLNSAARAFADILWQADVYRALPAPRRLALAVECSWLVIRNFYVKPLVRRPLAFGLETIRNLCLGLRPRTVNRARKP